ncbi:MAG TPA: sugar phosphate isomerase/epimerase family protein [Polyangiaceae bacterium]|nr:sugar phosphate isomerase/epimerase family protein [Polyangiaceae bacterium]
MKHHIGIMQGRLSPRPVGKLQAFPHNCWQREFSLAARLGFDAIEWIFEADRSAENPILTASGRAEIVRASRSSGVAVRSVCGDYFMIERLAGAGRDANLRNRSVLRELIQQAAELGAERILLPLLETSALPTAELKDEIVECLQAVAPVAEEYRVVLGLEMEIPGEEYADLIARVGHPMVKAYYDVGNSTAQGFDVATDVVPLLPKLHAVHIKDRRTHGVSVPVGRGDANFPGFFRALKSAGFVGDLLLQHFFDDDPEGAARAALAYVRRELAAAGEAAA